MRIPIIYIVFCFCILLNPGLTAQRVIKTNVLFPLNFRFPGYGGGIEVAMDKKIGPRHFASIGCNVNRTHISSLTTGGTDFGNVTQEKRTDIEKAGFRFVFKRYNRKNNDPNLSNLGFFHGIFVDMMAARTRLVIIRDGEEISNTLDGHGFFFGGGYCFGYTFRMGNWVIEPNVGIGLGTGTGGVMRGEDPYEILDVYKLDNMLIHWSASHIQLHAGYYIPKKKQSIMYDPDGNRMEKY